MRRHFGSALLSAVLFAAGFTLSKAYDECISSFSSGTDYFPEASRTLYDVEDGKFGVQDATLFGMEYHKGFKVVNNHQSKRQYILYRCGASLSDLDLSSVTLPTGYTRRSYSTPAQKVAAFDTTVLGYLQAIDTGVGSLGLADRLVSISSYAVDPCMRKAVTTCTSNKVVDGVSATAPAWNAVAADYHVITNATDLVFDWSDVSTTYNTAKTIPFPASNEYSLIGRAEWIKFVGAFFNQELSASRYYNKVKAVYDTLSSSAKTSAKRPVVAFVTRSCAGCTIASTYSMSLTRLRIGAVEDAGGVLASPTNGVYSSITKISYAVPLLDVSDATNHATRKTAYDKFLAAIADVDVLVDETYYANPSTATIDVVLSNYNLTSADTQYPFIANKAIYRADKIVSDVFGNDWFQGAYVNPQVILKDMIRMIHPENEDVSGYTLTYHRDLFAAEGPVIKSASDCKSTYPICDASVSSYPIAPLCAANSYKKCSDGTTVTLTASSGCSKMASCPASDVLSGGGLIALIVCMVLLGLAIIGGVTFFIRKQSAGGKSETSPNSAAAIDVRDKPASAI